MPGRRLLVHTSLVARRAVGGRAVGLPARGRYRRAAGSSGADGDRGEARVGETVSDTGRIQAENETRLAFRISGRMVERPINVGDHVDPGQVVAKLEPQDELNALRTAQASVAAAQGQLNQAQSNFDRQKTLLARDIASRAQFEQAAKRTAEVMAFPA